MEKEIREFPLTEVRADEDSGEISGYAAVFDQETRLWPDLDEVVRRGAFRKTINDGADVFVFFNHDSGKVLGRRKNGTLDLAEDDHGLRVSFRPPNTPTAQEARNLIRDGFVDKMSFGFEVVKQEWTERGAGMPDLRELKEVRLFEVSPVPIPAYGGTSVSARSARPEKPQDKQQTQADGAEPQEGLHSLELKRLELLRRQNQQRQESDNDGNPGTV